MTSPIAPGHLRGHGASASASSFVALAALLAATGCGGVKSGLDRAGALAGIAGGGTDEALIGTFRLQSSQKPTRGVTSLVVLRSDLTFHVVYSVDCATGDGFCPIDIDGDYRQFREFPDPSKAAGVALSGKYTDPKSGGQVPFYLLLRRAAVQGSPLLGLYHNAETAADGDRPYFVLVHPTQLWCADPSDCERQDGKCGAVFACNDSLCQCP